MLVSYNDIFDKKHEEYYQISPGINRISRHRWEEVKKTFESAKQRYTFPKLNASTIIEMMK